LWKKRKLLLHNYFVEKPVRPIFVTTIILFLLTACGTAAPTATQVTVTSEVTVTLTPTPSFTPTVTFTPTTALPPAIAEIEKTLGADYSFTKVGDYWTMDGNDNLHFYVEQSEQIDHVVMVGNTFEMDGVKMEAICLPADIKTINNHMDCRGFWQDDNGKWQIDTVARPAIGTSVEEMAATLPNRTIPTAEERAADPDGYKALRKSDRHFNDLAFAAEGGEEMFAGVKAPDYWLMRNHHEAWRLYYFTAVAKGATPKKPGYHIGQDPSKFPTRLLNIAFSTGNGEMINYVAAMMDGMRNVSLFDDLEEAKSIQNGLTDVALIEGGSEAVTICIYDDSAANSIESMPASERQKAKFLAPIQADDETYLDFKSKSNDNGFSVREFPDEAELDYYRLVSLR
jgi:hypothetical protein